MKTLAGDRGIEWGFARENLPAYGAGRLVLDLGPMDGFHLSMDAYYKGYTVIAVGLEDIRPPIPGIQYIHHDILSLKFDVGFDYILNISSVEHIGLGRYGDPVGEDFDLRTMARLREWMHLNGDGIQILTIPIGHDAVVGYYHRVYGQERLPRLLDGYATLKEAFWIKLDDDSAWIECTKEHALDEIPGQIPEPSILNLSYAIGGFILCAA